MLIGRLSEVSWMMIELTEQQRRAVHEMGGAPIEVIDPDSRCAYVILAREQYERMRSFVDSEPARVRQDVENAPRVPAGILQSQRAFWLDLPLLLAQPKLRGGWVCYKGVERIVIGTYEELIRECRRRGIGVEDVYFGRIRHREQPPWEPEEVEPISLHNRQDDCTRS